MELKVRPFVKDDYQTLDAWWQLHKWSSPPLQALPPNGIVVETVSQRICAGFLYLTDSSIAWLEFVVANPMCDKLLRDKALDTLIPSLLYRAKELGKTTVFSSSVHPRLMNRYEKHGAVQTDVNVTHFIWRL
jgi:hypothetical protein